MPQGHDQTSLDLVCFFSFFQKSNLRPPQVDDYPTCDALNYVASRRLLKLRRLNSARKREPITFGGKKGSLDITVGKKESWYKGSLLQINDLFSRFRPLKTVLVTAVGGVCKWSTAASVRCTSLPHVPMVARFLFDLRSVCNERGVY